MLIALDKAKKVAIEIGNKLLPFCDRLNLAGSIRRSKVEVGDIEIVCQPKKVMAGTVTLFGEDNRKEIVHPDFSNTVMQLGKIVKGQHGGRMMQIEINNPSGIPKLIQLDLFTPMPHDYYRVFAIRTGSADYSHKIIATAWLRKGWCGTPGGLRLQDECNGYKGPDGKVKWSVSPVFVNPTMPPAWQSEQEFFEWLGVQYLPPHVRYV